MTWVEVLTSENWLGRLRIEVSDVSDKCSHRAEKER